MLTPISMLVQVKVDSRTDQITGRDSTVKIACMFSDESIGNTDGHSPVKYSDNQIIDCW